MSELKVYKPYVNRDGDMFIYHKGDEDLMLDDEDEIYLKSEADKVIADKDKTIVELKDKLQNVSELLKETREWLIESQKMHKRCADNAIKQLCHHKYKRCLAMAKWCEMCHRELLTRACLPTKQNWNRHDEWRYFVNFWHRYEYRFKKLAEKFKEGV